MEEVAESQVYRLFLNTETGFPGILSNTNKASTSWLVDYDSLFNRDNYAYKNCRLRYRLVSQPAGSIDAAANTGVLAINGLSSRYVSKNTNMLPLDIIVPTMFATGTGSTPGTITAGTPQVVAQPAALFTVRGQLIADTMATTGVDIQMPFGMTSINPQFWQVGFGATGNADNILQTLAAEYMLILQFELYNPK